MSSQGTVGGKDGEDIGPRNSLNETAVDSGAGEEGAEDGDNDLSPPY